MKKYIGNIIIAGGLLLSPLAMTIFVIIDNDPKQRTTYSALAFATSIVGTPIFAVAFSALLLKFPRQLNTFAEFATRNYLLLIFIGMPAIYLIGVTIALLVRN